MAGSSDPLWLGAFDGRRVFVTGHTGFVGSWLSAWLRELGAEVAGYALPPNENQAPLFDAIRPSELFAASTFADLNNFELMTNSLSEFNPEIVFHLAAQPLVRPSYAMPRDTFEANVMGTVNVLEAVRLNAGVAACVIVTSDKCYENLEQGRAYRESDPIGGRDPYSASKGAAEIVTSSYARSFFESGKTACASARAGNIVGGGDFSGDRLVPDIVRAVQNSQPVVIRNPRSVRPWQHVLESIIGYLSLAASLVEHHQDFAGAWNFGPERSAAVTVKELVDLVSERFGDRWPGSIGTQGVEPHEAQLLTLDTTKAATHLGWRSILDLPQRIALTVDWYDGFLSGDADLGEMTRSQIRHVQSAIADMAS